MNKKRIIVGITGASGAIYGVRTLEILKEINEIETHLVVSKVANITISEETDTTLKEIENLADEVHKCGDLAASISSGSFKTEGMIIAPCSMKTLGEIANGISGSLMSRAADVVLKERRKLALLVRETPLNLIHINNMKKIAEAGGYICPPVPAFYNNPENINDIVNHTVGRVLDIFDIDSNLVKRWKS